MPARSRWLDIGCGTGSLSQAVLELADPSSVTGIDRAAGFIEHARKYVRDACLHFAVGDAGSLPVESGAFDAVISGLALNFIPRSDRAVEDMTRAVRSGGLVATYVWDYAGNKQLMRHFWNSAAALDPAAYGLDEGRRFPLCQPDPLKQLFSDAGLQDVEVHPVDIATHFRDFDDYWLPFLGATGPAPGYLKTLSDEHRAALRERVRQGLPFAIDGSISLTARAWAVRGVRR
jgi:SAM-dependent methyltransferase